MTPSVAVRRSNQGLELEGLRHRTGVTGRAGSRVLQRQLGAWRSAPSVCCRRTTPTVFAAILERLTSGGLGNRRRHALATVALADSLMNDPFANQPSGLPRTDVPVLTMQIIGAFAEGKHSGQGDYLWSHQTDTPLDVAVYWLGGHDRPRAAHSKPLVRTTLKRRPSR
jgi:hypothetical protein